MNENKKLLMLGGIVGVIILLLVLSLVKDNQTQQKLLDNFNKAYEAEEATMVFIGRPTCGYCQYMKPIADNMANEYGFEYMYINTDEISSANLNKILNKLGVTASNFGTPYTAVVKNGRVASNLSGYATEEYLFETLKEGGVLKEEDSLVLDYLSFDGFKEVLASNEKRLVVLGAATSNETVTMLEAIKGISKEKEFNFQVLNTGYLTEDEATEMATLIPYYQGSTYNITAPTTIVLENGDITATHTYTTTDSYVSFLQENGFVE